MKFKILTLLAFNTSILFSQYQTEERLVPYRIGDKWGLSDFFGHIRVQPQYDSIYHESNNLFVVKNQGKFGLIKNDQLVIPIMYDKLVWNKSRLFEGHLYDPRTKELKRINLHNQFGKKLNKGYIFSVLVLSSNRLSSKYPYPMGVPYLILGYYDNGHKKYELVRIHDLLKPSSYLELIIANCDRISQNCSVFSNKKDELSLDKNRESFCYKIQYDSEKKSTQLVKLSSKKNSDENTSFSNTRESSFVDPEIDSIEQIALEKAYFREVKKAQNKPPDFFRGRPNTVSDKIADDSFKKQNRTISNEELSILNALIENISFQKVKYITEGPKQVKLYHFPNRKSYFTLLIKSDSSGNVKYGLKSEQLSLPIEYDTIIGYFKAYSGYNEVRPKSAYYVLQKTVSDSVHLSGIMLSDSSFLIPMTKDYVVQKYLVDLGFVVYEQDGLLGLKYSDGSNFMPNAYTYFSYLRFNTFVSGTHENGYCINQRKNSAIAWEEVGCFKDIPIEKTNLNGEDVYKMADKNGRILGYAQLRGYPKKLAYYFYE